MTSNVEEIVQKYIEEEIPGFVGDMVESLQEMIQVELHKELSRNTISKMIKRGMINLYGGQK